MSSVEQQPEAKRGLAERLKSLRPQSSWPAKPDQGETGREAGREAGGEPP